MKKLFAYILLITTLTIVVNCLGVGQEPKRTLGFSDVLPGRFIREIGPSEIDKLLNNSVFDAVNNPEPGLPINDMLYLLDQVSIDKMIEVIKGLKSTRSLYLIYAIKRHGCNITDPLADPLVVRMNIPSTTDTYQSCTTSQFNHLDKMIQLINGTKDTKQLIDMVCGNNLTGINLSDCNNPNAVLTDAYKRYLEKMAFMVVYLGDPKKLTALINGVTDAKDIVYLVDSLDGGSSATWGPMIKAQEIIDNKFLWETHRVVKLMQQVTDVNKMYQLINGMRTLNVATSSSTQISYINEKLLPLIRGPFLKINNVGGYTTASTSLNVDYIIPPGYASSGDYLRFGKEVMQITTGVSSTMSSGTISVLRGNAVTLGLSQTTTPEALPDNSVVYISEPSTKDKVWVLKLATMMNQMVDMQKMVTVIAKLGKFAALSGSTTFDSVARTVEIIARLYSPNDIAPKNNAMNTMSTALGFADDAEKMVYLIDSVSNAYKIADLVNQLACISQASDTGTNNSSCNIADGTLDDLQAGGKKLANVIARISGGSTDGGNMYRLRDTMEHINIPEKLAEIFNSMSLTNVYKLGDLVNNLSAAKWSRTINYNNATRTPGFEIETVVNHQPCHNSTPPQPTKGGWNIFGTGAGPGQEEYPDPSTNDNTAYPVILKLVNLSDDPISCNAPNKNSLKTMAYLLDNVTDANKMVVLLDNINEPENMADLINKLSCVSQSSIPTGNHSASCNVADGTSSDILAAGKKLVNVINGANDVFNLVFVLNNVRLPGNMATLINSLKTVSTPKVATLMNNVDSDSNGKTNCNWSINAGVYGTCATATIFTQDACVTSGAAWTLGSGRGSISTNRCSNPINNDSFTNCTAGGGTWTAGDMCKMVNMIDYVKNISDVAALIDNITDGNKLANIVKDVRNSSNLIGLVNAVIASTTADTLDMANFMEYTSLSDMSKISDLVNNLNNASEASATSTDAHLDHNLVANLMAPFISTGTTSNAGAIRGGAGYGRMVVLIASLSSDDTSPADGQIDASVRIAQVMKGLNNSLFYNNAVANISKAQGLVRLLVETPGAGMRLLSTATSNPSASNIDMPGIGPRHMATMMNSATSAGSLITLMNSTNISDVSVLVGCSDHVNEQSGDSNTTPDTNTGAPSFLPNGSIGQYYGPDFYTPCNAISLGWID